MVNPDLYFDWTEPKKTLPIATTWTYFEIGFDLRNYNTSLQRIIINFKVNGDQDGGIYHLWLDDVSGNSVN